MKRARAQTTTPQNSRGAGSTKAALTSDPPEIVFYYPGPIWTSRDFLKNLLLFFDGIALLVPRYMKDCPEQQDPVMVGPLRDAGLLHLLEPETLVDSSATKQLATAIDQLIRSGVFEGLEKDAPAFQELSYSRLGGFGDPKLARAILDALKARHLARDSEDGVSIPLHPLVRTTVLVLLAQILRPRGKALGLSLCPATDIPGYVHALCEMLRVAHPAFAGRVVAFDLETVAPDLGAVPLDEVLGFRNLYAHEYKAYARSVRRFVRELGDLPTHDREQALQDRQEEIRDLASDLNKTGWAAWKKPASFALSIAGAAWTLKAGDPIGAFLAAAGILVGASEGDSAVNAYTYLFRAKRRFG